MIRWMLRLWEHAAVCDHGHLSDESVKFWCFTERGKAMWCRD